MRASLAEPIRATASAIARTLAVLACIVNVCIAAGQPASHTAATLQPAPNATEIAAGRNVFRICGACHSLDPGRTIVGPSLAGLIGRPSGSAPGFDYSPAMKQAHIIWTPRTLDAYLADPQKVVPGNRMPFAGLQSALDRTDVIAFLETIAKSGGGPSTLRRSAAGALPNAPAQPSASHEREGTPHPMPDMP